MELNPMYRKEPGTECSKKCLSLCFGRTMGASLIDLNSTYHNSKKFYN